MLCILIVGICSISILRLLPTPAESAVMKNLNSLKNLDTETIKYYLTNELFEDLTDNNPEIVALPDESIEVFKHFASYIDFKILNSTHSDTKAAVKIQLTTINSEVLLKDFYKAALTHNISQIIIGNEAPKNTATTYFTLLKNLLEQNTYETSVQTTTILLTKINGEWMINPTRELEDNLMGNFNTNAAIRHPLTPEETLEAYLDVIKEMTPDDLMNSFGLQHLFFQNSNSSGQIDLALAEQISNCFDYQVLESTINGTHATVTVEFTTFHLENILAAYNQKLFDYSQTSDAITDTFAQKGERIPAYFLDILQNNTETYTTTATITLENSGNMWYWEYTSDFIGILTGDLNAAANAFLQPMIYAE